MIAFAPDSRTPDFYCALSEFIRDGTVDGLDSLFAEGFDPAIAAVYRNGFHRSCREVLASTFPTVRQVLGESAFGTLVWRHVAVHPPRDGTLTGYGRQFPRWLVDELPETLAWIAQLAHLDRAWLTSLHGQDATPLSAAELQDVLDADTDIGQLRLALLPNAQLIDTTSDVLARWLELRRHLGLAYAGHTIEAQCRAVLMWRPAMTVQIRPLCDAEGRLLADLQRHRRIDEACAALLATSPQFDLAGCFADLLAHGVLQSDSATTNPETNPRWPM